MLRAIANGFNFGSAICWGLTFVRNDEDFKKINILPNYSQFFFKYLNYKSLFKLHKSISAPALRIYFKLLPNVNISTSNIIRVILDDN